MNQFNVHDGDLFVFTNGKKNVFLEVIDDSGKESVIVREIRTQKNETKDKEFPLKYNYIPKGQELAIAPYSKLYFDDYKQEGRPRVELFVPEDSKLCRRYSGTPGYCFALYVTKHEAENCFWYVPVCG